jgi:hypothetical protein
LDHLLELLIDIHVNLCGDIQEIAINYDLVGFFKAEVDVEQLDSFSDVFVSLLAPHFLSN